MGSIPRPENGFPFGGYTGKFPRCGTGRRATGATLAGKRRDTCKAGKHPLEAPNLIGQRECRACKYERDNRHRRERRNGFYIAHRGHWVGNCQMFWAVDGHGYTCNLDEAWCISALKAKRMRPGLRPEDVLMPAGFVRSVAARHVDMQRLRDLFSAEG